MVIHHARLPDDEDLFAPYDVIGQLGTRPIPVYVARQSALAVGGPQLVIAEHFPGACKAGKAAARTDLRREARRISTLANPHLARVREVAVRGDDLVVFGDFIDGEKLSVFWRPGEWLPLEIVLRSLLDVLTGIGALHGLRDSNQQPMKLIHGEISPSTVLFGADGVARVLHAVARRAADATAEEASLPYLAPEVHSNDASDGRADVFSVGVLLWEVLEGKYLSDDGQEPAGLRVRSGPLPAPSFPEKAPWAKALVPVVVKALAAAPEDRWATAAAMAAEIRKAAGLKLAAASAAAAFSKSKFGERVKERRARWEARPSRPPGPMASPRPDTAAAMPAPVGPALAVPVAASSSDAVVPPGRSEEFSSSILESYMPPPPVPASPEPSLAASIGARAAAEASASPVAPVVVAAVTPPLAPARAVAVLQADPPADRPPAAHVDLAALVHDDAADLMRFDAPPSVPSSDSALSIPSLPPPLVAARTASIPGPPSSAEAPVPFEAPVVFDEADVGPVASPLGEPSPMPPALSTSDAPAGSRSRRRHLIFGGVAALGIAAVSVVAVRGSHHAPSPAVVSVEAVAAPVPPPPLPASVASAPATQPAASVASPAPPPSVAAVHAAGPKPAKGGPKPKPPAAGGSHPKSSPVRPQTRSKPASAPTSN